MSWRAILGADDPPHDQPLGHAHNTHNAQKHPETPNCADSANSADRQPGRIDALDLRPATHPPAEPAGNSADSANSADQESERLERLAGIAKQTGLTLAEVKGACPPEPDGLEQQRLRSLVFRRQWGTPPAAKVRCLDCRHFERIAPRARVGRCLAGEPPPTCGFMFDTDSRTCSSYRQRGDVEREVIET